MELRQLRYVVLLAEQLHFGRAAGRAFITQSAFSQQIALLERELEIKLFERGPSGVAVTAAGERFVEHARGVLSSLTAMEREIRSLASGHSGKLSVGVFGAGAGELMPIMISSFRRAFPDVELEFRDLSMSSQVEDLLDGTVDVAIVHPLFDTPDLELTPLFDEPRLAALAVRHPLAEADELSVQDLANEPFVMARTGTPPPWMSFWSCGDLWSGPTTSPRAEMNSVSEGLAAVAYLDVVDTVPSTATRYHRHPGVTFVPLRDASYSTVAVARRHKNSQPTAEAFCALARKVADQHHSVVPGAVRPRDPVA